MVLIMPIYKHEVGGQWETMYSSKGQEDDDESGHHVRAPCKTTADQKDERKGPLEKCI